MQGASQELFVALVSLLAQPLALRVAVLAIDLQTAWTRKRK
jgi:hypothetical protein